MVHQNHSWHIVGTRKKIKSHPLIRFYTRFRSSFSGKQPELCCVIPLQHPSLLARLSSLVSPRVIYQTYPPVWWSIQAAKFPLSPCDTTVPLLHCIAACCFSPSTTTASIRIALFTEISFLT